MNLKTFRANSMADALALVKKDLGKDAVILSTRSLRVGGFLGFGGRSVIEITASDQGKMFDRKAPGPGARAGNGPGESNKSGVGAANGAFGNGGLGNTLAASAYRHAARAEQAGPGSIAGSASSPVFHAAPEIKPDPLAGMLFRPVGGSVGGEGSLGGGDGRGQGMGAAGAVGGEAAVARELPVRSSRLATSAVFAPVDASASSQIQRELQDIKLLVNQVLQSSPPGSSVGTLGAGVGMPDALFKHYLKLIESRMARDIADAVIGAVRDELSPGELTDEGIVRTSVLRHIAGLLPTDQSVTRPGRGLHGRPFVMAMVGPTGVGKTTTVAKLAAAFKLRHGRSVALITSDTYRIAAVDQLRTYASIIGLPLKVVLTPEEMSKAIEELSDAGHDLVIVDTAGRSQHNADRIGELSAFLDAARPDQTHLVLSSAACESVLVRTAHAFAATRPNHILFTKLDEAVNFGVLVNVVHRVRKELRLVAGEGPGREGQAMSGRAMGLPLSFVTTGQEVPDHIEPGRPDRLARAVLDNRLSGDDRPGGIPSEGMGNGGGSVAAGEAHAVATNGPRAAGNLSGMETLDRCEDARGLRR